MENILKDINIPNNRIKAIDGKKLSDDEIYSNFICDDFNKRPLSVPAAQILLA